MCFSYLCFLCDYILCSECAAKEEIQKRKLSGWLCVVIQIKCLHWKTAFSGSLCSSRRTSQALHPSNIHNLRLFQLSTKTQSNNKTFPSSDGCQLSARARVTAVVLVVVVEVVDSTPGNHQDVMTDVSLEGNTQIVLCYYPLGIIVLCNCTWSSLTWQYIYRSYHQVFS